MLKITYFGHSSFKVENENFSVIFDPYQNGSVPGLVFPCGQECNYLSISHEHADHNARALVKENPIESAKVFNYLVPHDKQNGTKRGMTRVRIVDFDGVKVAHMGDICDIRNKEWLKPLLGVDIVLCPINGFFTISASEAKQLFDYVNPKVIVPMHYQDVQNGSGYDDDDEIGKFKELFSDYKEIDNFEIQVDENFLNNKAWIFKKIKQ